MDRNMIATEIIKVAKLLSSGEELDINQVKKEFDTRGLEAEIRKRAGFDPKLSFELKESPRFGRFGLMIETKSNNLVDKVGLFSEVFNDVRIDSDGNISVSKDTGELVAWISVGISWAHRGGGTNGARWFTAWYEFDKKKWTFRDQ